MTTDDLTYAEIVELANSSANLLGLTTSSYEKDESLFVTIIRATGSGNDTGRAAVTFWSAGTGAFLVDFDDKWSWQVLAYDREDQADAVDEILRVASKYLDGAGEERRVNAVLRSEKIFMEIPLDGGLATLRGKSS